ncbi:MAG TPA: hypothetical protein VMM18_08440 [Gemmatimonadaceae bacterium]|nr:hypothetical protein [Gemmatimonadaceae bacterium]
MVGFESSVAFRFFALTAVAVTFAAAVPAGAQTDYYNADRNRPVRIEDAYTVERHAFELKVAPLRLERGAGGVYHWGFDPEIAYGILPRTSIEVAVPFAIVDAGGTIGRRQGIAGVALSAFHNLNTETRTVPALGLRADLLLPVGSLAADRAHPSVSAIATRTFQWARVHVNGQYTGGRAPAASAPGGEEAGEGVSRWLAGAAVDRAFPLHAALVIADLYAAQPLHGGDVEWNAGGGVRYQVSPSLAVDVGAGRRLTGDNAWYVTFGSSWMFVVRRLIPISR